MWRGPRPSSDSWIFPAAVAAAFVSFVVGGAVAFVWTMDLPERAEDSDRTHSSTESNDEADYDVLDRYDSCAPPGAPEVALRTSPLWTYCRGPFSTRNSFGMYGHEFQPEFTGLVRPNGASGGRPVLVASYRVERKDSSPPAPVLRLQAFGAYLVGDGGAFTLGHPPIRPTELDLEGVSSSGDDTTSWYRYAFAFPVPREHLSEPITLGVYYEYRGNILASRVRIHPDHLTQDGRYGDFVGDPEPDTESSDR